MTLQAQFPLSASNINVELGLSGGASLNIGGAAARALAGVPSGLIRYSDFLGKSAAEAGGGAGSFLGFTTGGSGSPVNFASQSFGVAVASRRIAVAVHWQESDSHKTLNSATIGGVAATIHLQSGHFGGLTGFGVAIISAAVPSGTSGTVSLTFAGGGVAECEIGRYRLIDLSSGTPHDTGVSTTSVTAQNLSTTINIPSNGVLVTAYTGSTFDQGPITMGGATARYADSSSLEISIGAMTSGLSAQTGRVISATSPNHPTNNAGNALVGVSWG